MSLTSFETILLDCIVTAEILVCIKKTSKLEDFNVEEERKKLLNIKFINIIIRDTFSELKVPGNKITFSNLLITAYINPYTVPVESDFFQITLNAAKTKYP